MLWCFVSVLFPTVVDQVSLTGTAKHPYIDLGSGPAGSNAITQSTHQLEGTPHKNLKKQDFPKDKSNQFLLSGELLMCSLRSWFPKKNRLSPRFPKRIASADHFLSPKSPAFCNNGHCRHVLSCGPALTGFVFAWEKRSAHYWQTFAVHFHRLVTLKPYFPICNQSGPCQRNP